MAKARPITNLDAHAPTGINARIIARTRLEELYEWAMYVDDPCQIHELHNLRIAAKRLRYTLEVFAKALPEACSNVLKELEQIQDELGALHDADAMVALLRLCLASLDDNTSYEQALIKASHQQEKGRILLNPEVIIHLLDPAHAPSTEQRQGLERVLLTSQKKRESCYNTFRQHWYRLQKRKFRQEVIALLEMEC